MGLKEEMLDMGFPENRATRACIAVHYESMERAIAWLENHENDADIDEPITESGGNVLGSKTEADNSGPVAEVTEGYIPLTEEQMAAKAAAVQEKLKERRAATAEKERQDKVQAEKIRRKEGKSLREIREEKQADDMKKLAAERRQAKIDDAKSRKKILDQIQSDRDKAKAERESAKSGAPAPAAAPTPAPVLAAKVDYSECRLQLRMPTGAAIVHTFKADETLGDVVAFIREQNVMEEFSLGTSFPRKVFDVSEYSFSLKSAGLCPSSVLIVAKKA